MSTLNREVLGGTVVSLMTTELNSLASGSSVIASVLNSSTGVFDNTAGTGISSTSGDGYTRGYLKFTPGGAFGGSISTAGSLNVWFLKSIDAGSTYESGSASHPPVRLPDAVLPLNSGSTAAADNEPIVLAFMAGTKVKAFVTNASGQALPSSGNTLTWMPATDQGS